MPTQADVLLQALADEQQRSAHLRAQLEAVQQRNEALLDEIAELRGDQSSTAGAPAA